MASQSLKLRHLVLSISVYVLVNFCLLSPAVCFSVGSQTASENSVIKVTGSSSQDVEANYVTVQLGVDSQNVTATHALDDNAARTTKVILRLKSIGFNNSEISTSQFNIQPVYDSYTDNNTGAYVTHLTGYSVSNSITVSTLQLEKVSDIIDEAVRAGANRIDSVNYGLSSSSFADLKKNLLAAAVQDAVDKAQVVLKPLQYHTTGVKTVTLNDGISPPLQSSANAPMSYSRDAAPNTPVFASTQTVQTSVSVTFFIQAN
eukprot:Sdes_comp19235_c0_seq1m10156